MPKQEIAYVLDLMIVFVALPVLLFKGADGSKYQIQSVLNS